MDKDISWGLKYNKDIVTIEVYSYKCLDIKYTRDYICRDKQEQYSEYDKNNFLKIRDDLMVRVEKEHTNKSSDAEVELKKFIKDNSGIWDLTDTAEFILYYKKELLNIMNRI